MKLRQARKVFYTCGRQRRGTAIKAVRRFGRLLGIDWWRDWFQTETRRIAK
jgi:hypothetical protein